MKKSIAVIGLSRFGLKLVENLHQLNIEILAIDIDKENVKKASEFVMNAVVCDSTQLEDLRETGIQNVDHVVVAIGQNIRTNLSNSIITIVKLKELGITNITARADEDAFVEILRLVGAKDVISPLSIASQRIASKLGNDNVIDYFNIHGDYDVYEVKLASDFLTIPIIELDLRSQYKMNILLIIRNDEHILPSKDISLMPNDDVFIFGRKKDVVKITHFFMNHR